MYFSNGKRECSCVHSFRFVFIRSLPFFRMRLRLSPRPSSAFHFLCPLSLVSSPHHHHPIPSLPFLFLPLLRHTNIRQHDIRRDPVPAATYDHSSQFTRAAWVTYVGRSFAFRDTLSSSLADRDFNSQFAFSRSAFFFVRCGRSPTAPGVP